MQHRTYLIATLLTLALFSALGQPAQAAQRGKSVIPFGTLAATDAKAAEAQAKAWLKEIGKTDAQTNQRFAAIWQQSDRAVVDRLADTLALGSPNAAALLRNAKESAAPTSVPKILSEKNASAFFRSNLALAYARHLMQRQIFEQALVALKTTDATQVADPAAYLFCRSVCEYSMLRKDDAGKSLALLLDDVLDSPKRYKTVAVLMLLDMQSWKERDLGAVARKMKNLKRRLRLARGGPKTQKLQREVVRLLDKLIDRPPGDGPRPKDPPPPGPRPPREKEPEEGDKGGQNPRSPMDEPTLPAMGGGPIVNESAWRHVAGSWGRLPERERSRILQELTRGMTPFHREAVENYFRKLAEAK